MTAPPGAAPASVVVPTIGRPAQLREALASLAACRPGPAEVVVVDQSGAAETSDVVSAFAGAGMRLLHCTGRGIGRAINAGLRDAGQDAVFVTNDDCTVAADWIAVGLDALDRRRGAIVTGSVLPAGDADGIPSLREDPEARDYTGTLECAVLYGANMAAARASLLELDGFDERIRPSAEDNDLCYRWLRSGRPLVYLPELRVWHHDWRSPAQLAALYRSYGRGQGVFYAKHLRAGDRAVLRLLARDVRWSLAEVVRAARRGHRPPAEARGMLTGLPRGLVTGWRTFG